MGIKRLFSLLAPAFDTVHLKDLKIRKLGVDGMAWVYQAFFCNYDSSEEGHIGFIRQLDLKINLLKKLKIDVS